MASSSNMGKEREGVERMMEKMNLTERESAKLVIDEEAQKTQVPQWALIGKVLYRRGFHVSTIENALRPAWGNPRGLSFSSVGENIFVVNLETKRDRDRIWEGGPWAVGKHAVVLEIFDFRSRPDDWKFDKMQIWARVTKLPYNLLCSPWPSKIAGLMGDVVKVDVDAIGFAWGEALRARIWIKVHEPLMRWVQLESAETKETIFYDIQYENLPYFCFSCGVLGHSDLYCPRPAVRDEFGRLPYSEALRMSNQKHSWGNAQPRNQNHFTGKGKGDEWYEEGEEEEVEVGEEVTSPDKTAKGKVKNFVYQFNARGGGNMGQGGAAPRNRGRGNGQVYRRVNMDGRTEPVNASSGQALMLLDQETLDKKRHSGDDLSNDSREKKRKAMEDDKQKEAEAASQPRQNQ